MDPYHPPNGSLVEARFLWCYPLQRATFDGGMPGGDRVDIRVRAYPRSAAKKQLRPLRQFCNYHPLEILATVENS